MAMAWLRGVVAWFTGQSIRERQEQLTEAAKARAAAAGKLFDAYPDRPVVRRFWVSISTRGPGGRFIVEQIDLGWPIELTAWDTRGAQRRVSEAVRDGYRRLLARLVSGG